MPFDLAAIARVEHPVNVGRERFIARVAADFLVRRAALFVCIHRLLMLCDGRGRQVSLNLFVGARRGNPFPSETEDLWPLEAVQWRSRPFESEDSATGHGPL